VLLLCTPMQANSSLDHTHSWSVIVIHRIHRCQQRLEDIAGFCMCCDNVNVCVVSVLECVCLVECSH